MLQKRIGVVLIVGKGKGVRQVVGEFPQGVVLPHGPVLAALETLDLALDVILGIRIVMSPELVGPQRAFEVGQGIAVRLEGAEQKGKFESLGGKSVFASQKSGCQQLMTTLLQGCTSVSLYSRTPTV